MSWDIRLRCNQCDRVVENVPTVESTIKGLITLKEHMRQHEVTEHGGKYA